MAYAPCTTPGQLAIGDRTAMDIFPLADLTCAQSFSKCAVARYTQRASLGVPWRRKAVKPRRAFWGDTETGSGNGVKFNTVYGLGFYKTQALAGLVLKPELALSR